MAQPQIAGNKTKALRIGQRLMTGAKSFGDGIKNSVDTSKQVISQSARKIKSDQKKINMENKKQQRFEAAVKEETARRQKGMFSGGYKLADQTKKMVEKVAIDPLKALWNIVLAWAIKNLPKIVEEVRKFIKKVRIVMAAINNAFRATGNLFKGWLSYGKGWLTNMLTFDWNDSQGRLKEAQQEIDDAQGELDASWDTMYNVWGKEEEELDKMLAFLDDGKTVKQTVDAITSNAPMPQTPVVGPGADNSGSSPSGGTSGDGGFRGDANNYGMSQDAVTNTKWKPILNLIASAESIDGSYSSAYNPSGSKIIPGLENMTIKEAVEASGGAAADGRHYAIGRYQFTTLTAGQAALAGLSVDDKFSPENQDKMAIALIEKKKGVTFDMLRNDPGQAQMLLAQEWAGLPKDRTDKSYYGGDGVNAAHRETTEVRGAFQSALDGGVSTGGDSSATPSGTISGGATSTGDTLQRGDQVSGYSISSAFGMRMHPTLGRMKGHGGLDIACPQGTYLAVSVDVEIVYASTSHGGYGGLIDAWAPSLGVQFRFAHMNVVMCSPGQKVKAGTAIGRSGGRPGTQGAGTSTGPHVHYEISTKKNDATYGGSQSPQLLAKYAKYIILSAQKPTTTLNGSNTSSTAPAAATDLSSAAASNRTNGRQQNNHTTFITQLERVFTN